MTAFLIGLALSFVVQGSPQSSTQSSTQSRQGQAQSIDGDWTVVYAEMDGKKQEGKSFTNVRIRNNTVTCNMEGKEKSWKLDFGPNHMVRTTELEGSQGSIGSSGTSSSNAQGSTGSSSQGSSGQGSSGSSAQGSRGSTGLGSSAQGSTHHGVYIAGQDFLCISFMKGGDQRMSSLNNNSRQGQDVIQAGGQSSSGQGSSGSGTQSTSGASGSGRQGSSGQGTSGSSGQGSAGGWQMQNPMGSEFVLILRRAGATDR